MTTPVNGATGAQTPANGTPPNGVPPSGAAAGPGTATPEGGAPPSQANGDDKSKASLFAALAKKERALTAERAKLKAEREEMAKHRQALEAFERARANAKRDPLGYLKAGELSYEDVTNAQLSDGAPSPALIAKHVDDRLEAWEAKLAEKEKAAEEEKSKASAAQTQAYLADWQREVADYVKGKPDDFELINLEEAHPYVTAYIEQQYQATGRLLTTHEAAEKVEAFLLERALKRQQAKKLQAKAPPQPQGAPKPSTPAQPRSLSNDMTVSTASASNSAKSEKERFERAMAALSK